MLVINFDYTETFSKPEKTPWGDGRFIRSIVLLRDSPNDNYKIGDFGPPFTPSELVNTRLQTLNPLYSATPTTSPR